MDIGPLAGFFSCGMLVVGIIVVIIALSALTTTASNSKEIVLRLNDTLTRLEDLAAHAPHLGTIQNQLDGLEKYIDNLVQNVHHIAKHSGKPPE